MHQSSRSLVKSSKSLSWILRHGATKEGLSIDSSGYVRVSELLQHHKFTHLTLDDIHQVVLNNNKKRFVLKEEGGELYIRASQGHSIKVIYIQTVSDDSLLTLITDPSLFPLVIHGTYKTHWPIIQKQGLFRMNRNHIHFSQGFPGDQEVISGLRKSADVIIVIDLEKAMSDGIRFYLSQNGVILTSGLYGFVGPKYFKDVIIDKISVPHKITPIDLDYYFVLDFEANCIQKGRLECQEIIEFPVGVINARSHCLENTFHYYVRPEVVPTLSEFCTELTGITQDQVANSLVLNEILDKFDIWVNENYSNTNWVFVTCGEWDLRTCLPRESKYKKIQYKLYYKSYLNIKKIFPNKPSGMIGMLDAMKIPHIGRHHSGIDDVRNIAEVLIGMLKAGVNILPEDISHLDD